jgi:hypothetical protein
MTHFKAAAIQQTVLKANMIPAGYQCQTIPLTQITIDGTPCQKHMKENSTHIGLRQFAIAGSIGLKGMRNPIMVTPEYQLLQGGCRLMFADVMGYDAIDCVVVANTKEMEKLQLTFVKSEYDLIPEKHVYKTVINELEAKVRS